MKRLFVASHGRRRKDGEHNAAVKYVPLRRPRTLHVSQASLVVVFSGTEVHGSSLFKNGGYHYRQAHKVKISI